MGVAVGEPRRGRSARPISAAPVVALGILAAALLGIGAGVALHFLTRPAGATSAPTLPTLEGQAVWPAGEVAAPDFTLRDQSGRLVSLRALRGRPVVLAFMDSRCREVCPLEGRVLARAIAGASRAARPILLVASVDPWADTPSSARAAASHWAFTGRWHWLFGSRRRLGAVWRSYRIYVRRTPGDVVHSAAVYLIDRRGFERAGFLYPFLPGPLQRDIETLAGRGGRT